LKSHHDKELRSVISFLLELAEQGTLELGQKEALTKAINNLRRTVRGHDLAKIRKAIGQIARIFLRVKGR